MSSPIVALQPDDYGPRDASSPRWAELLATHGFGTREVNVYRAEILEQLRGCSAFMWRWGHTRRMHAVARRLLPVLERELGIPVYPDQNTCWHYDDKIAQALLLEAREIPRPRTWVWFDRDAALEWSQGCRYPLVFKLAGGAGSTNVRLVESASDARRWIEFAFGGLFCTLDERTESRLRRLRSTGRALRRGLPRLASDDREPQGGYVLFQEFLPGNAFDTRVTVIGNRAFGFRRLNRVDDFRASGSGRIDWDQTAIDLRFVRLAFEVASRLRTQSCAIDGLWRGEEPVVAEISYTYASWGPHQCPGRWVLEGDPKDGTLTWIEGQMWPEEAQVEDFVERLRTPRPPVAAT